ncbi:trypsin-like peptidase domain-containing protein [bacterium]|nr:trypsin-like peptidase domain-containing protein [bacterium]
MKQEIKEGEKVTKEKRSTKGWVYLLIGLVIVYLLGLFTVTIVRGVMSTNIITNAQDRVATWFRDFTDTVKIESKKDSDTTEEKNDSSESKNTSDNIVLNVTSEEKSRIEIVKQSMPSVVSIAVSSVSLNQSGTVDTTSNIGTGFIVDSSGIVVTNNHVVEDTSSDYVVVTSDGTVYKTKEILKDSAYDIAIIQIDTENKDSKFTAIELGDSDNIVAGQSVIAIGTPLGEYAGSVTTGIISGLNRSVTAGSSSWYGSTSKTYEGVIQTDAAINSGNSGGPLINSSGEVIGVNFATTSSADNISFALPINKVKERLKEYKTYGKFIKPYLGVSYETISQIYALYYNVVPGAFIKEVESGSPADKAGIKKGDIITTFDGQPVTGSLTDMIQTKKVGDTVEIKLYRDKEYVTVSATLKEAD